MTDVEQQLTDHLRRQAAEVLVRYDLKAVEQGVRPVEFVHRVDLPNRRLLNGVLVGAVAAALVGVAALATLIHDDQLTTRIPTGVDTSRPAVTTTLGPSSAGATSGAMWPQSSLDEVREAQELADAGDPAYTWQIDPRLSSAGEEWWGHLRDQGGSEIVERFLRDELGWEAFLFNPYQPADGAGKSDGTIGGIVYLRCAPGETNPLYPTAPDGHQEAPGAELCAPTIDEFRYETVQFYLSQLDRQDRTGIWVVTGWTITAPFTQTDPRVLETETTARLQDFLAARIAGEGAEGYVQVDGGPSLGLDEVPLLYSTSTGAPYERFEFGRVSEPQWPYGDTDYTIWLFAEDGATVVEQRIRLATGRLLHNPTETTENGEPLARPYVFFDGDVTLSAAAPWEVSWRFALALTLGDEEEPRIELVADSLPVGCARGPAPSDASALARSIQSDPDLQMTAPVEAIVGGVAALAMDITVAEGASVCEVGGGPGRGDLDRGSRMRLYLVDLPEGSASRILAIAVVAREARFDDTLDAVAPILESIEFHTDGG